MSPWFRREASCRRIRVAKTRFNAERLMQLVVQEQTLHQIQNEHVRCTVAVGDPFDTSDLLRESTCRNDHVRGVLYRASQVAKGRIGLDKCTEWLVGSSEPTEDPILTPTTIHPFDIPSTTLTPVTPQAFTTTETRFMYTACFFCGRQGEHLVSANPFTQRFLVAMCDGCCGDTK